MYSLTVKKRFSAAHLLHNYQGKCANLHGHTWLVELTVTGTELDDTGMLVDFGCLKGGLEELVKEYDHRFLNDLPDYQQVNPTAENMARVIYTTIKGQLADTVTLASVTVWESPDACATYQEVK